MMSMHLPPLPLGDPPPGEEDPPSIDDVYGDEDENDGFVDPIERLRGMVPTIARFAPDGAVEYSLPDPLPRVHSLMIDADLADQWLAVNTLNRSIRDNFVDELVGVIRRGEWLYNGETFKFSTADELLDGQHRLKAIVKADIAVPGLVVFDLPPETQDTVDTGVRRSVSDTLKMKGEIDAIALAALMNRLFVWAYGEIALRQPSRFKLSTPQALAMLAQDPQLRESLRFGRRMHELSDRIIAKSMIAANFHRFREISEEDAIDFWTRFATGNDSPVGHPTQKLRATMRRNAGRRAQKMDSFMIHALVIKAWNFYRMGVTNIHQLSFRAGGKSPETFPIPR